MTSKEWDVVENKLIPILTWIAAPSIMYYFHIKKRLSYFWRGVAVVFCTSLIFPILMITVIPLIIITGILVFGMLIYEE